VPKDFLQLLGRPASLLEALRRIALGGAVAATGVAVHASPAGTVVADHENVGAPSIVDQRSRKSRKLVLQLPSGTFNAMLVQHRSHRSHSSHSSHRSSSGGTTAPPVTAAPPTRGSGAPTTALGVATLPANLLTGDVESIDLVKRIIVIKVSATSKRSFAYRDDSKFQTPTGIEIRFDEFADASGGRLPVAVGQKVQVQWRTSTGSTTQVATLIKRVQ
jgi:hypothetical protein